MTKSASAELNERPAASSNVQRRGQFIVDVGYSYFRVGDQAASVSQIAYREFLLKEQESNPELESL